MPISSESSNRARSGSCSARPRRTFGSPTSCWSGENASARPATKDHRMTTATEHVPRLNRVLGLRELVLYGIVLIQPTAPMPLYGVVATQAGGHVVTTILIGMVAMLFTAVSYGRMAGAYPSAGSAYTYVGRELHPALGYLTGWSMIFDYLSNPIIFIGFMGVTLAAFGGYVARSRRKTLLNLVPPLLGFAIYLYIWCSLRTPAKLAGLAWLAAGLAYGAWKTR